MPVLCGTFSIGTSCEYAFGGAVWRVSPLHVEEGGHGSPARAGWGSMSTQLPRAGRAAQCACVSGDMLMTWLSRTYTKYRLGTGSYSVHSLLSRDHESLGKQLWIG